MFELMIENMKLFLVEMFVTKLLEKFKFEFSKAKR